MFGVTGSWLYLRVKVKDNSTLTGVLDNRKFQRPFRSAQFLITQPL